MSNKLYAKRDIEGQEQYYLDHIMAMTGEDLHSKSDIAAELAHRDQQIDLLQLEIELLREKLRKTENGEGDFSMLAFKAFNGHNED